MPMTSVWYILQFIYKNDAQNIVHDEMFTCATDTK